MKNSFIRKLSQGFINWCADNSAAAKLERCIFQGVLGVGAALLSSIAGAPEWVQMALIPIVMAIVTPVQAKVGESLEEKEGE